MSGEKAGYCKPHHCPRSECRPAQTHTYAYRLPGDLMAAATREAIAGHISINEFVKRAIAEKARFEPPPDTPEGRAAARLADTELDRLRAERAAELAPKELLLAEALEAATEENPVTPADLQRATGTESSKSYVSGHLAALLGAGAVGYRKDWRMRYYWPVPGADIRKAMKAPGAAEGNGKAPDAPASKIAPRKPAMARTAPAKAKSAAREKAVSTPRAASRPPVAAEKAKAAAVVQAGRDAGHDVKPTSEITAPPIPDHGPAAIFMPPGASKPVLPVYEPGPSCPPHPKRRVHKGFCGACGRPVGDDERIK